MNEEQFKQLLIQAYRANSTEKQAAVLAIVDQHEGIVHRAHGDGNRLLHWASEGGNVNLMRGVIDRGSVVNAKDSFGADALMYAALRGHIPAATLLLDHGADLNATDNRGRNALMYAACNDKLDCAIFLLNRGSTFLPWTITARLRWICTVLFQALAPLSVMWSRSSAERSCVQPQRQRLIVWSKRTQNFEKRTQRFVAPLVSMLPCSSPTSSQTWSS